VTVKASAMPGRMNKSTHEVKAPIGWDSLYFQLSADENDDQQQGPTANSVVCT
jgi:hypothetical protein